MMIGYGSVWLIVSTFTKLYINNILTVFTSLGQLRTSKLEVQNQI